MKNRAFLVLFLSTIVAITAHGEEFKFRCTWRGEKQNPLTCDDVSSEPCEYQLYKEGKLVRVRPRLRANEWQYQKEEWEKNVWQGVKSGDEAIIYDSSLRCYVN